MNPEKLYLQNAARLRVEAQVSPDALLDVEAVLTSLYPVACVALSALSVDVLRDYLKRHRTFIPPGLLSCHNRRLRGGIVALCGYSLLFVDRDDPIEERRFTLAHEAAHYLSDHLYPRLDLINRLGESIRDILDGMRPPTLEERMDALLARTSLTHHTHLLDREGMTHPDLYWREADADAFACEILAPIALLRSRFPNLVYDEANSAVIEQFLVEEFGLPRSPASEYARAFLAQYGEAPTLLHRLRLV